MDKQTLSNYGWIVITVLVLAVMLALATPFGSYVGDAVVSVANGYVGASNNAMDEDNISNLQNKWDEKLNGGNDSEDLSKPNFEPMGQTGECYWYYEAETATLHIWGNGDMDNFTTFLQVPWYTHISDIVSVKIYEGVTIIGKYAFYQCSNLTSVTIPNSVTTIGICAFARCTSLENITLPEGLTHIQNAAFQDCTSLESITIPNSVTIIGIQTFAFDNNLESINFEGTMAQWNAITFGDDWNYSVYDVTYVQCSDGNVTL